MRATLRSNPGSVFVVKVWVPILLTYSAAAVFGRDFPSRRSVIMIALLALAAFAASTAIVEVRDGSIRYRRLLKWKVLARDEVIGASEFLGPLASLQLNRNVLPWGRIYFVLDLDTGRAFKPRDSRLLSYIRGYKSLETPNESLVSSHQGTRSLTGLKLLLASVGGLLVNGFFRILWKLTPAPSAPTADNWILKFYMNFEVQLLFFVVFVLAAAYRRHKQNGLVFAFLAGMGLPNIALHWLWP
jgi:hypothetical protein